MTIRALESIAAGRLRRPGETFSLDEQTEQSLVERGVAEWADDSTRKTAPAPNSTQREARVDSGAPSPGGASQSQAREAETLPADRGERIRAAVEEIAEDPARCTKSGKPTVPALKEATGLDDVTAKERDAAFDALQPAG